MGWRMGIRVACAAGAMLVLGNLGAAGAAQKTYTVADVLAKAAKLQQSKGFVSDHVEGGHTHFFIKAAGGYELEICPHPKMGLLHIMQAGRLPGTRLVVEVNLANEVTPYKRNILTTIVHQNSHSSGGLRYLADKGMRAIMDAPE